jgi:hypothetical protein
VTPGIKRVLRGQRFDPADEAVPMWRVDRDHRRHLAGTRTLARIRRLEVPALLLSIGERQINVAGDRNQVSRR